MGQSNSSPGGSRKGAGCIACFFTDLFETLGAGQSLSRHASL